jgi:hypothetical protein
VYECTSAEEVVDLLAGGQGVFGIAVSGALKELHGSLAHLPAERAEPTAAAVPAEPTAADELGQRRRRRTASA